MNSSTSRIGIANPPEIHEELKKILPPQDIPGVDKFLRIYWHTLPRLEFRNIDEYQSPLKIAQKIATVFPKESLNEIKEKASQGDSNARLQLGDCIYFGLKGLVS